MVQENLKEGNKVSGFLHIHEEGYGFLRQSEDAGSSPDDVYVFPAQIQRFNLKPGDFIHAEAQTPKSKEMHLAVTLIEKVNQKPPEPIGETMYVPPGGGIMIGVEEKKEISKDNLP